MKDELPEIPQENIIHTHSMCDQLHKTSDRWFTHSHRTKIFTQSRNSIRKQAQSDANILQSETGSWERLPMFDQSERRDPKMKMITFMREQIEICCQVYGQRMNSLIQDQARTIRSLGQKLQQNQIELINKNKIIETITKRTAVDRVTGLSGSSTRQLQQKQTELNSYFGYIQQQQIDINRKCEDITDKLSRIELKYKDAYSNLSASYYTKINENSQQLHQRLDRLQKMMQLGQCEPINNNRRPTSSINKQTIAQIYQNISYLQSEINQVKIEVAAFKKKKYCYQNYKIEQAQSRLAKIEQMLNRTNTNEAVRSAKPNLNSTQMTRTTSIFGTHSEARFRNNYRSQINQPEQALNSCSDSDNDSDSQSEVEQMQVSDVPSNLQRFAAILRDMQVSTPLKIEIDQTGYAKSVNSGMYLVDSTGDGFDFTPSELDYLLQKNIILI